MRQIVQVQTLTEAVGSLRRDLILACCDDGTLWVGRLVEEVIDTVHPVVEWKPLNGPPDGEFFAKKAKPFWDRFEEKLKREAETPPYATDE